MLITACLVGTALAQPIQDSFELKSGVVTDPGSQPPSFIVTNTTDLDDGACEADCSLREAIAAANVHDSPPVTISFDAAVFDVPRIINLESALPDITNSLNIAGPGANMLTVRRDSDANYRIFTILDTGLVIDLSGLTISNGQSSDGGGIYSNSELNLHGMVVSNNLSGSGGGVNLAASGVFENSTISGNTALERGGGITFVGPAGSTLQLVNSTVSSNQSNYGSGIYVLNFEQTGTIQLTLTSCTIDNTGTGNGFGILLQSQDVGFKINFTMANTILTNSPAGTFNSFSSGGGITYASLGYNLASDGVGGFLNQTGDQPNTDPLLGPLADNGGPTRTHALLAGSTAIDKGKSFGLIADQRGLVRPTDWPDIDDDPSGDGSDIGAFELQPKLELIFLNGFEP